MRVLISFGFLIAIGMNGFAADGNNDSPAANKKGPAFTEPPRDDPDYDLLGEFTGDIEETAGEPPVTVGLQVRPIGGGKFDAVVHRGGLPGQSGYSQQRYRMSGQGSGEFLVLSGGPWAVFVERQHCLVIDRSGRQLGRLARVKRQSPTLGAAPPIGAMILFDGTNTDMFTSGSMTAEGWLTEGSDLKPMFQDFDLHVEFRLPYMPRADGQQRGNSGLYLQSRYECQVLDSFATDPVFNGLGAVYRFKTPDLNMAFPPLVWQTYDVRFTAARWASDKTKMRNARVSTWVNGVQVQNDVELPGPTGAGQDEEPTLLPIRLQDHGDPVRYRNIWIIDRGIAPSTPFPVFTPPGSSHLKTQPPESTPESTPEPEAKAAPEQGPAPKPENDADAAPEQQPPMKDAEAEIGDAAAEPVEAPSAEKKPAEVQQPASEQEPAKAAE